jgi:bacillithiol biosynthesis cysteine-adding enzyme BshC
VIANASSSSAPSRPEHLRLAAAASGLLPPLPVAFLEGRDRDLLDPVRFLAPGDLPSAPFPSAPDRREIAAALAVANRGYGHGAADELAARLADPQALVVFTGQQPGLLGGPLFAFSKAVAAALWAETLERETGRPAVALFWVATEDHDYAEVSSVTAPTSDGLKTFDLGPDTEPLAPVGMRTLGPAALQAIEGLKAAVPGERYHQWLDEVARWYRPEARFGEAFCRLLARMLGPRCPLLVDSMLPALKSAQRPYLKRVIERRHEIAGALAARDAEIERRGYGLRITPSRGASPLFLLSRGERRRIEWRGDDAYALRGREGQAESVDGLLQIVDENPGVVSPGVFCRAAIQDAVFGTALQVLGPGEVSYMPQVAPIYPLLGVAPPWVTLRPQTLVLEPHHAEKLAELGLTLGELLGDRQQLDTVLARKQGADFVAPVRQQVAESLDAIRRAALAVDPNLERPYEKTREQILRALDLFAEKAVTAAARRDEVQSRRIEQLRELVLPGGKHQERTLTTAHFQGKYGDTLADTFWQQMELDPTWLQVIQP